MTIDKINYKGTEFNITNNIYSPEEVVIGVYIKDDGTELPLYRKRIAISYHIPYNKVDDVLTESNLSFAHGIENVDFIRINYGDSYSIYDAGETGTIEPTVNVEIKQTTFVAIWFANKTHLKVRCNTDYEPGVDQNVVLIVEYTKTTDVEVVE